MHVSLTLAFNAFMQRRDSGHIGRRMLEMELRRKTFVDEVKEDMQVVGVKS